MQTQAPYHYIRDYYRRVQAKYADFPDTAAFGWSYMEKIHGASVLNLGCGPLLYDDMTHFGRPPGDYVGLDINRGTFEFLRRSRDPRLLRAKSYARDCNTRIEYRCTDVLDDGGNLEDRFDCVLGVGFFATFQGARFERLMAIVRHALKEGGLLVKLTWHGPHRTAEETRKKLAYRYDNADEVSPEGLVAGIERCGFTLRQQSILACDPDSYGWDSIQACVFRRA